MQAEQLATGLGGNMLITIHIWKKIGHPIKIRGVLNTPTTLFESVLVIMYPRIRLG